MEEFPVTANKFTTPDANDGKELSCYQQQALDCSACFFDANKAIEATNIAHCREANVITIRSALLRLEGRGMVTNIKPPGARRNLYQPTTKGLHEVTPGHITTHCVGVTVPEEKLPPAVQEILDCSTCLAAQSLPIGATSLGLCQSDRPAVTIAYGLKTLTQGDYLTNVGKGGPKNREHRFALTPKAEAVSQGVRKGCDVSKRMEEKDQPTEFQRRLLKCIGCLAAQDLPADVRRLGMCLTDSSASHVYRNVNRLVDQGAVVEVTRLGASNPLWSLQTYRLSNEGDTKPTIQPGCTVAKDVDRAVYEGFSPERKRLLGCLACISDKIKDGAPLPGASAILLERCTGLSGNSTLQFADALAAINYCKQEEGYSRNPFGVKFIRPKDGLHRLMKLHREAQPDFARHCALGLDRIEKPPVHIRNAIIECVGCSWTQKIASGEAPVVSIKRVAACRGLDPSHLARTVIPELVESGDLAMAGKGVYGLCVPTSKLRPMLGYSASCKSDTLRGFYEPMIGDGGLLYGVETIGADIGETETYQEFQNFVEQLRSEKTEQPILTYTGEHYDVIKHLTAIYPLLTAKEEAYLSLIIQKSTNARHKVQALTKLVGSNAALARWIAKSRWFERSVTSFEDVEMAALTGIYKAAQSFDSRHGTKFSSYAYYKMLREIQIETARFTGIDRYLVERIPTVIASVKRFYDSHGRSPNIAELVCETNYEPKEVQDMLAAYSQSTNAQVSLDDTLAEAEIESTFDKVRPYLNDMQRRMLEQIIVRQEQTLSDFYANDPGKRSETESNYSWLLSLLRHPYFGIGGELDNRLRWQHKAQCARESYDDVITTGKIKEANQETKELCARCPVHKACGDFARIAQPYPDHGIWGGKTVVEIDQERYEQA